jgi:hypothetical protein
MSHVASERRADQGKKGGFKTVHNIGIRLDTASENAAARDAGILQEL